MRVVIQRVSEASVTIGGQVRGRIGLGFVVLLGIEDADTAGDIEWLCGKIARPRVFGDEEGLINCSLADVGGGAHLLEDLRGERVHLRVAEGEDGGGARGVIYLFIFFSPGTIISVIYFIREASTIFIFTIFPNGLNTFSH